jgi:hypothetical protein
MQLSQCGQPHQSQLTPYIFTLVFVLLSENFFQQQQLSTHGKLLMDLAKITWLQADQLQLREH